MIIDAAFKKVKAGIMILDILVIMLMDKKKDM